MKTIATMSVEKPSGERTSELEFSEPEPDPNLNILDTIPASEIQVDNYHGITVRTVGVYNVCDDPLPRFVLNFRS